MQNKELFLPISKNRKYGFVDKNRNIVIKPKFNYVSERFREDYCVFAYIKKNKKF